MLKNYLFLTLVMLCLKVNAMEKEKELEHEYDLPENEIPLIDSPRTNVQADCLLILPDEVLLILIIKLLEPIPLGEPYQEEDDDPLHLKKAYGLTLLPLNLSCKTIQRLVPIALHDSYLIKLYRYSRTKKIEWAQQSYNANHFLSTAFLLTSLLSHRDTSHLQEKKQFFQKLIFDGLISIEHNSFRFRLSQNDIDNENLCDIILKLISDEDTFITIDTIFDDILKSSNNKQTLHFFITYGSMFPNNYLSSELMRDCFHGNIEEFKLKIEDNPQVIFASNQKAFNAITWAIIGGDLNLLDYIFSYITRDLRHNTLHQNILHTAALYASPSTLEFLFSKIYTENAAHMQPVINGKDINNQSPLNLAILSGSEHKTLFFLNKGADIRTICQGDLSAYSGTSRMLKKLVKNRNMVEQIATELNASIATSHKPLSAEDIILCCKNSKKKEQKLLKIITFLGSVVGALLILAEAAFK